MENENLYNDGLAPDPRTEGEKAEDYKVPKLPEAGVIISWTEKPKAEWKKYVPRNQSTSKSCMAQAGAKGFETMDGVIQSAHPPYRSRANFPQGGMWMADLGNTFRNNGTTTEALDKSQNQNEAQLNRNITVATPNKVANYWKIPPKDINAVAEAIELHKHCILIIHCYKSEWLREIPLLSTKDPAHYDFGHGVCAVDYFLLNGQKVLLIEDSTGHSSSIDKTGRRIITEDFLKARIEEAMFFTPKISKYVYTRTLRMGDRLWEVITLQKALNLQGYNLKEDGVFGKLTDGAVRNFQSKRGLVVDGIVGRLTAAELAK